MSAQPSTSPLLQVKGLHASVDGKPILKGIDLAVGTGEVHAVMGPNGSGKSTLANVIAGRPGYEVTAGSVHFAGQDVLTLDPHERAALGLFLGFQYPVEIPGVSTMNFLRTALNAQRRARGEDEVAAGEFLTRLRQRAKALGIAADMLKRGVNEGFSGGEKKRNEMLQLEVLEPRFAVLDETDSGLDIDALKTVADGINRFRGSEHGVLLITHYQRLLNFVVPDRVHVLMDGAIVHSGDKSLALELEKKGYAAVAELVRS